MGPNQLEDNNNGHLLVRLCVGTKWGSKERKKDSKSSQMRQFSWGAALTTEKTSWLAWPFTFAEAAFASLTTGHPSNTHTQARFVWWQIAQQSQWQRKTAKSESGSQLAEPKDKNKSQRRRRRGKGHSKLHFSISRIQASGSPNAADTFQSGPSFLPSFPQPCFRLQYISLPQQVWKIEWNDHHHCNNNNNNKKGSFERRQRGKSRLKTLKVVVVTATGW